MRSKIIFGSFALLCLWLFSVTAFADSFTFDTLPSVPAPAGSTVGWGYSITNKSSTNWLITTMLNADLFLSGTPLNLFDFPILAPGAAVSTAFDEVNSLGLYQFTWDPGTPAGTTNAGTFTLSAEWWDGDPFAGGNFISLADDTDSYTTTVLSTSPSPVPEPSSALLLISGLSALLLTKRKLSNNRN